MRLARDRGVTVVEYALGLALVVGVAIGAVGSLEDRSSDKLNARGDSAGQPSEQNGNVLPPTNVLPPPDPGEEDPETPPTPSVVHLTSLTSATEKTTSDWAATVTIVVSDSEGPLAGVSCTGSWSPSVASATTSDVSDDFGRCVMTQGSMKRNGTGSIGQVTFSLTGLTGTTVASWDSGANADATTETINAPT